MNEQELEDVVETVSNCVKEFGLVLELGGPDAWGRADKSVTSRVRMTGSWQGELTVGCSETLAQRIAAKMCDSTPEELSEEAIRDALGELTHIIGGNIKALFRGSTQLSLPTVVRERLSHRVLTEEPAVQAICLISREHPFALNLTAQSSLISRRPPPLA